MPAKPETSDAAMRGPRLRLRLDFGEGRRIGPGKIDLIEAVGRTGSISAAGRAMGMSYRRSWLLVSAVNEMFQQPVVSSHAGGKEGGGAELTAFGTRLVTAYRRLEARSRAAADEELSDIALQLVRPSHVDVGGERS